MRARGAIMLDAPVCGSAPQPGSDPIGRIQIGNNQTGRTYDMVIDDVVVDRAFI